MWFDKILADRGHCNLNLISQVTNFWHHTQLITFQDRVMGPTVLASLGKRSPDNFEVCQKCTRSLAHKLALSPGLLQFYDSILKEQLNRGFIELVTEPDKSSPCHYIPHHPVNKDSVTTPVQIVYDCSCRQSSELNDCLLTGPHCLQWSSSASVCTSTASPQI